MTSKLPQGSITGAGVPITLNGKSYIFSPFSDKDFTLFDNWVRQHFIDTSQQSVKPNDPQHDRKMETIYRVAAGLSALSGTGARIAATLEGMTYLAYLGIRKEHPNLTPEMLHADILADASNNIKRINTAFRNANTPPEIQGANSTKKGGKHPNRQAK